MMFAKFPIHVVIFKRYGNILRPAFDRGRYERKRIKTQDGFIENNYLILKKEKVKIPAPPISFYYDIENTRYLYLLQIDRYTYYPLSFEAGKIKVNFPSYLTDKKGNILKDEKGNPKITFVEKTLFDSDIILEDGRLIPLPNLIANKTYDKEHWLSNEIETASRLYRSKGFWEKYGNFVTIAIVGIVLVMFFYVGVSKYAELTKTLVDGLKEISQSMNVVADKLAQAVRVSAGQPVVNVTIPPH
jgi:hypothetical protein